MDAFLKKANPSSRSATQKIPSLTETPARLAEEHPKKKVKLERAYKSDADSDEYQINTPLLKPRPDFNLRRDEASNCLRDDDVRDRSESEDAYVHGPTAIENTLPEIKPDKQTIEEYQNSKAAQSNDVSSASSRLDSRTWVRGQSSLYVDAFNLALDTVLDDETHLFDDKEKQVFEQWRSLSYEAQFLYDCSA